MGGIELGVRGVLGGGGRLGRFVEGGVGQGGTRVAALSLRTDVLPTAWCSGPRGARVFFVWVGWTRRERLLAAGSPQPQPVPSSTPTAQHHSKLAAHTEYGPCSTEGPQLRQGPSCRRELEELEGADSGAARRPKYNWEAREVRGGGPNGERASACERRLSITAFSPNVIEMNVT